MQEILGISVMIIDPFPLCLATALLVLGIAFL